MVELRGILDDDSQSARATELQNALTQQLRAEKRNADRGDGRGGYHDEPSRVMTTEELLGVLVGEVHELNVTFRTLVRSLLGP